MAKPCPTTSAPAVSQRGRRIMWRPGRLLGLALPGLVLAAILACGGAATAVPERQAEPIASSPQAPAPALAAANPAAQANLSSDFSFTLYQGAGELGAETLELSQLLGKPVVLNFWAGLCPPCRAEMPEFQEFYEETKDRVTLVGIDVGPFVGLGSRDDAADLLMELGVTYPAGFPEDGSVLRSYGVLGMPTTVFIDSEGGVFRKWTGPLDRKTLDRITNDMIGQDSAY